MIQAALHLTAAALMCLLLRAPAPVFVVGLVLGVLPDIDTPRSLIGRLCAPLSRQIEARYGHRSITHSLLALAVVAGVAYWIVPASWPALAGAYASHLLIDLLIGVQGIQLFWPSRDELTITSWRDDGPAPQRLLLLLLPLVVLVALWGTLGPLVLPRVDAALAVANPIATVKPSPSVTSTPTVAPSIHLSFALPAGVTLSALRIKQGATIREGQLLASWERPKATPWPSPTAPVALHAPAAPSMPEVIAAPVAGDTSAVVSAQAALAALNQAQPAERAALVAQQAQERAAAQRAVADAQRVLDLLQPMHEREQQEAQTAVDTAHQALLDQQAAQALVDTNDPVAVEQAQTKTHGAEAALRAALDSQSRMRSEQGIARQRAEAVVAQAQADLEALPTQQQAALAKLDADHAAALVRARGALAAAQTQSAAQAQMTAHTNQVAQATVEAERRGIEGTATAQALTWSELVDATTTSYNAAVHATAQAQPTPAPDRVVSRAAGKVVGVSAQEQDGTLIVTLEIVP